MSKRRKRKVDYGRMILVLLVMIALVILIVFAIKFISDKIESKKEEIKPIDVINSEDTVIENLGYNVYLDEEDEIGFNFIVANLRFSTSGKVSFDLGNLVTSEDIKLNSVFNYKKKIQEYGVNMGELNVVDEVNSENGTYSCNILIPFHSSEGTLTLTNSLGGEITFDLSSNVKTIKELAGKEEKEEKQGTEVQNENNKLYVSDSFVSTMMKHNGEDYEPGSTTRIYTFKLNVVEVDGLVTIEKAEFIPEGSDEVCEALEEGYYSEKVENIISKQLKVGENGALFFQMYSNDEAPNYNGTLRLKFSNSDKWVEIPTTLK